MIVQNDKTILERGAQINLTLTEAAAVALSKATTNLQRRTVTELQNRAVIDRERVEAELDRKEAAKKRQEEAEPDRNAGLSGEKPDAMNVPQGTYLSIKV